MTPTSIKFAGSSHNKPGTAGADHLMTGAPAIRVWRCPKCNSRMRAYKRQNGEQWLMCTARRDCGLHVPAAVIPEPDAGLSGVKAVPVAQLDGLAGLRAV